MILCRGMKFPLSQLCLRNRLATLALRFRPWPVPVAHGSMCRHPLLQLAALSDCLVHAYSTICLFPHDRLIAAFDRMQFKHGNFLTCLRRGTTGTSIDTPIPIPVIIVRSGRVYPQHNLHKVPWTCQIHRIGHTIIIRMGVLASSGRVSRLGPLSSKLAPQPPLVFPSDFSARSCEVGGECGMRQ